MLKWLALVALALATPAVAQSYPSFAGEPVIDLADVIPANQEAALNQRLREIQERTKHQVAVVIVRTIGDQSIEDYGVGLFRHLGLGDAQRDDGVLLTVAMRERRTRIDVGHGLEGVLTDAQASRINEREIIPIFRAGRFADGVQAGVAAIDQVISAEEVTPQQLAASGDGGGGTALLIIFVILPLVGFSIWGIWYVATAGRRREARVAAHAEALRREVQGAHEAVRRRAQEATAQGSSPARSPAASGRRVAPKTTSASRGSGGSSTKPAARRSSSSGSGGGGYDDSWTRSSPTPTPSSSSWGSSSSSYDGGGGSCGGGGDSGSW